MGHYLFPFCQGTEKRKGGNGKEGNKLGGCLDTPEIVRINYEGTGDHLEEKESGGRGGGKGKRGTVSKRSRLLIIKKKNLTHELAPLWG